MPAPAIVLDTRAAVLWEQVSGRPVQLSSNSVLNPTFEAVEDGTYTFRLTATAGGVAVSDIVTVTVENADPEFEVAAEASPTDGAVLLSASFTDLGILDEHSVEVDWGDGSPVEVHPVSVQGAGWGSVALAHVYELPGVYETVLSVSDDDGGRTSVSTEVEVVIGGNPEQAPGFSLWAASEDSTSQLRIAGRAIDVEGRVHANSGLEVNDDGVIVSDVEGSFTVVGDVVV